MNFYSIECKNSVKYKNSLSGKPRIFPIIAGWNFKMISQTIIHFGHQRFLRPTVPPHPNICPTTDKIYIDILGGIGLSKWSRAWSVPTLLLCIQSFLDDPHVDRSDEYIVVRANSRAAQLYILNRDEYFMEIQSFIWRTKGIVTIPQDFERMLKPQT